MRSLSWTIVALGGLLAACAAPPAETPPAAAGTPAAAPQARAPQTSQPPQQFAVPAGSTVLSCTPIVDKPPPAGQTSVVQPFQLLLDPDSRPLQFVGSALPVRIPYQVDKIEPATGPPEMRVGAIIHYASKDPSSEMHAALAIMKDGAYRVGVEYKTPTQSSNGLVLAGHGTCVGKPA
jgi:hypothetical protein